MAIRMRIGTEDKFDAKKMVPGEWAVSKDTKYVRMCFAPGVVARMATYEGFEQDMKEIQLILATCQDIQEAVERFMQLSSQHASQAEVWSDTSKSWAVGGTETREGEDTDNSKYYSEQSKAEADRAKSEADRAAAIVGIDVDSELSETSANPVQNKVITKALQEIDVDITDKEIDFEEAKLRENIESGETIPAVFGKIKKWFSDLKPVSFTGKYSDLSETPEIPTVNNGTLTIQKNGVDVQTFTANQSNDVTANIAVPTLAYSLSDTVAGISALDAAVGPVIQNQLNKKANIKSITQKAPSYNPHDIQLIWGEDNCLYVKVDTTYAVKFKGFAEYTND